MTQDDAGPDQRAVAFAQLPKGASVDNDGRWKSGGRAKFLAEGVVVPHNRLRHVAHAAAKRAREGGGLDDCLTALLFSALALEAFFNALGTGIVRGWPLLERKLVSQEKLDFLAQRLEYKPDFGSRPFQTIRALMRFRNAVVHAKPERTVREVEGEGDEICRQLDPEWVKMCGVGWAERAVKDVDTVMNLLFELSGLCGGVRTPSWLFLHENELRAIGSRLPS
jgi:hypothetical protein